MNRTPLRGRRRHAVAERDGWRCRICWRPIESRDLALQRLNRSQGYDPDNLRTVHVGCHSAQIRGLTDAQVRERHRIRAALSRQLTSTTAPQSRRSR